MRRGASIDQILRPLDSGVVSQCFLSDFVQVADILDWILSQVGASEVWQTSFSVSDEFLRRLYSIRKRHDLTKFTMILDHKATNKTIKLWPFVRQVVDNALLADNHSKVMVVVPKSQLPPPSGSYNFSEPYARQPFRVFAHHHRP
ncbi:MAG: hypothetical protein NC095_07805 [Muribaculum sp.]|nr:hypothetical protein [Muribaculum sp.]